MNLEGDFCMLIDGELVESEKRFGVVNPATGRVFAQAPDCSEAELDRAVQSAARAFPAWRALSPGERGEYLRRAGAVIAENAALLARLLTREQGRPVEGAQGEIAGSTIWLNAYAAMEPPVVKEVKPDGQRIETRYVPLGVVCAISPWNFPVSLSIWKMAPALMAGNTMVLKPSPYTPLTMLKIGELLKDVFPAGVLNIVSGGDELGPRMTAHPGFAKISFTGSTATGKRVMASAAADLKRLTLELGGNDASIVMPDVDIDEIAQAIFFGAFYNRAQICVATKRLYVHEDIYEGLRDRLVAMAKATKIGDGSEQGTVLGPVQNHRQFERVTRLIDEARSQGLTLLQGPDGPANGGFFVPLTIVDNPPEEAAVVQEEAFGPVLPMMRFKTIDEVIARANASEYGLAGSIWSADVDRAIEIAKQLETGTVWINQGLGLRPDTPFAGHKQSGFGVENGVDGMLEYMVPQAIYISG